MELLNNYKHISMRAYFNISSYFNLESQFEPSTNWRMINHTCAPAPPPPVSLTIKITQAIY